jgi:hypothetical protein
MSSCLTFNLILVVVVVAAPCSQPWFTSVRFGFNLTWETQLGTALSIGESPLALGVAVKIAN